MAATPSDELKRDAVRIALPSGLTRRQVASDLGIGLSTLGKWIRAISDEAKVPERDSDLLRENERLRKENRILREEREVLKKRLSSSRHKSHEVSIHCELSRQAFAQLSLPHDGRDGSRIACMAAQAPAHPPAARYGDPGAYSRPAPAEPGQLWQAAHDRRVEWAGPSGRPAPRGSPDAPERHSHRPQPQVQAHH